jgi:hypothetical protein
MHVVKAPDHLSGVIQGDLPGQVALRDWVAERMAYWADPPRGECTTCGAEDELLGQDDPRCASCRRKTANRHQAEMYYPCDRCGASSAIRDPAHRRDEYLCLDCHKREGYEPGERAMVFKAQARVGATHSMARRITCIAAGKGTDCKGEVKQRSDKGLLCNFHHDPKRYLENKAP